WNGWDSRKRCGGQVSSGTELVEMRVQETVMTPMAIRALREHLHLTQEVFASILGASFATVNRWENSKTVPTGDYARILQTLQQFTVPDLRARAIYCQRPGRLSRMA